MKKLLAWTTVGMVWSIGGSWMVSNAVAQEPIDPVQNETPAAPRPPMADDPFEPAEGAPPATPHNSDAPDSRDPTVPQGELRLLLMPPAKERPKTSAPLSPVAPPPPLALPDISVRALVIGANKSATALLSLQNKYYVVTPGRTYDLVGARSQQLKVLSITREGVTLELLPDGQQLILP